LILAACHCTSYFCAKIGENMSKRREQELLMELVELIHEGKINEASTMLDKDADQKICKYCDEVCNMIIVSLGHDLFQCTY
jgi:hypothetical protein